jgi:hypothetical protein
MDISSAGYHIPVGAPAAAPPSIPSEVGMEGGDLHQGTLLDSEHLNSAPTGAGLVSGLFTGNAPGVVPAWMANQMLHQTIMAVWAVCFPSGRLFPSNWATPGSKDLGDAGVAERQFGPQEGSSMPAKRASYRLRPSANMRLSEQESDRAADRPVQPPAEEGEHPDRFELDAFSSIEMIRSASSPQLRGAASPSASVEISAEHDVVEVTEWTRRVQLRLSSQSSGPRRAAADSIPSRLATLLNSFRRTESPQPRNADSEINQRSSSRGLARPTSGRAGQEAPPPRRSQVESRVDHDPAWFPSVSTGNSAETRARAFEATFPRSGSEPFEPPHSEQAISFLGNRGSSLNADIFLRLQPFWHRNSTFQPPSKSDNMESVSTDQASRDAARSPVGADLTGKDRRSALDNSKSSPPPRGNQTPAKFQASTLIQGEGQASGALAQGELETSPSLGALQAAGQQAAHRAQPQQSAYSQSPGGTSTLWFFWAIGGALVGGCGLGLLLLLG